MPQLNYFVAIIEVLLLTIGVMNIIFFKIDPPKSKLIIWIILFAIVIELINGQFRLNIIRVFLYGKHVHNLCLILILIFYLNSYRKLIIFIRTFLVFIFATIILVGFYHIMASSPIFDFQLGSEWRANYYFEKGRLTGLIYTCSNDSAAIIVIFLGFVVTLNLMKNYRNKLNFLILVLGSIALLLTFTRSSWIAFIIIVTAGYFLNPEKKKKVNYLFLIISLSILLLIIISAELIDFSPHLQRLQDANIEGPISRLVLYRIFFESFQHITIGNGLFFSDATSDFYNISGMRVTMHNQFMDYVLIFGFPFTIFLIYKIILQLIKLFRRIKENSHFSILSTGIGLFLAQIGLITCNMFSSDRYFYIFLLYLLIDIYLHTSQKENKDLILSYAE